MSALLPTNLRPVAARAVELHTHDDPTRLHIGCDGCIARAHLDQDIAGALEGVVPSHRPVDRMHIRLVSFAFWFSDDDDDAEFVEDQNFDAWVSSGPAGSDDWADWALLFVARCPDAARAYLDLRRGGV